MQSFDAFKKNTCDTSTNNVMYDQVTGHMTSARPHAAGHVITCSQVVL